MSENRDYAFSQQFPSRIEQIFSARAFSARKWLSPFSGFYFPPLTPSLPFPQLLLGVTLRLANICSNEASKLCIFMVFYRELPNFLRSRLQRSRTYSLSWVVGALKMNLFAKAFVWQVLRPPVSASKRKRYNKNDV